MRSHFQPAMGPSRSARSPPMPAEISDMTSAAARVATSQRDSTSRPSHSLRERRGMVFRAFTHIAGCNFTVEV